MSYKKHKIITPGCSRYAGAGGDLPKGDLRLQSALSISQLAIINRLHIQKINRNQKEIMLSGDIKVSYSIKTQDLFELLSN